jgi:hypothetical protein
MKAYFSKSISVLFSPPGWIVIYLIAAFYKGLFGSKPLVPLLCTGLIILFTILIIYILYRKKIITHIDIVKREERIIPLIVSNVAFVILIKILHVFHLSVLATQLQIFAIIFFIMTIITFWYKISMHMTFTFFFSYALFSMLRGYSYLFFIMIPLMFWSRLQLKRHTVGQLILAILICLTIITLYNV